MDTLDSKGNIPNEVQDGPYQESGLALKGAQIVNDPLRGKVLSFNGKDNTAESLIPWQGHRGVRITMWVKPATRLGQSLIIGAGSWRLFRQAEYFQFQFRAQPRLEAPQSIVGAESRNVGEWIQVEAEFDPEQNKATIRVGNKYEEFPLPEGSFLDASNGFFLLGDKINTYFEGCVDDVTIEVMH